MTSAGFTGLAPICSGWLCFLAGSPPRGVAMVLDEGPPRTARVERMFAL